LKLTVTVQNDTRELVDEDTRDVQIPDLGGPLALSTLRVYRSRNSAELRALTSDAAVPATAAREFDRSARLFVRFDAYSPLAPAVTAQLLNKQGKPLTTLAVAAPTAGRPYDIDLPLSSLAPGAYVVRVDAKSGDATATEHVAFVVK
jgi:hypothetical protein